MLANTPILQAGLTKAMFKTQFGDRELNAVHTLKLKHLLSDNLCNLVTMTNTPVAMAKTRKSKVVARG